MIQVQKHPPNWNEIKKYMPDYAENGIFAWGVMLYNPKGLPIDPGTLAHEEMHSEQQFLYGGDAFKYKILPKQRYKDWWNRYLRDKSFWLAMELPAYQKQYWELEKAIKDRNKLNNFATLFAKELSREGLLTTSDALKAIQSNKLIKFNV